MVPLCPRLLLGGPEGAGIVYDLAAEQGEMVAVPFEDGELRAVLRVPSGDGRHPLALIIPGSDSTKEESGLRAAFSCPRRCDPIA